MQRERAQAGKVDTEALQPLLHHLVGVPEALFRDLQFDQGGVERAPVLQVAM